MNRDNLKIELEKARQRVSGFDAIDGRVIRDPGTIMAALECGLLRPESGAQYDAYVMLEDATKDIDRSL